MSTKVGKYRSVVKRYLEEHPKFRERRLKDAGLAKIIIKEFFPQLAPFSETITEVVKKFNTMDRDWRWLLEHEPHLRGSDYDEKATLEVDAQQKLGYPAT